MTTLELSALILTGEFALVSWGILFVLLRRQRQRHHEDHAHAGAVMEHLETSEISRRDALSTLFETTYKLEGEDLASKVDEYVAREKAFYNAMLNLYLNRDGAGLKQIPDELAKVLTPWAEMTPTNMVHASDVADLETEKSALAAELDNTKTTLEQLMEEYMAAFKRNEADPETPAAAAPAAAPPPAPAAPPAEPPPPEEPPPPAEPPETSDDIPETFDQEDLDIQSEPKPEPPSPPEERVAEADPPPLEGEPIDQAALDAMLDAFSAGADAPEETPEPAAEDPMDEDARAREELEGLADLFGTEDDEK